MDHDFLIVFAPSRLATPWRRWSSRSGKALAVHRAYFGMLAACLSCSPQRCSVPECLHCFTLQALRVCHCGQLTFTPTGAALTEQAAAQRYKMPREPSSLTRTPCKSPVLSASAKGSDSDRRHQKQFGKGDGSPRREDVSRTTTRRGRIRHPFPMRTVPPWAPSCFLLLL